MRRGKAENHRTPPIFAEGADKSYLKNNDILLIMKMIRFSPRLLGFRFSSVQLGDG